ncbi:RTA-like protein [Irpex rosettiformis]|uniref:RTA-like protein n=1 Tax=Irpex rosettiformis TaxID=378272 RepID=A0ACB8UL53_9APHY|nr:RTA-like protein [Irpex rosettiformis]
MFVVLFGISTLIHTIEALRYRIWWLIPTVLLAGAGEIIGWAGRLWSTYNLPDQTPFMMQIVCTIIAPTPLLAAIFIIFTRLTQTLGTCYSRLSPRWYSRVFLTCDIIALVIQGAGGGIAAGAKTNSAASSGGNIMLAGIVFQLGIMPRPTVQLVNTDKLQRLVAAQLAFVAFATEFFYRFVHNRPILRKRDSVEGLNKTPTWNAKLKLMSLGLAISMGFLIIRSIYRTVELGDGWTGRVLRTQVYFNVFDGAMVLVAIFILNAFHPGFLLFSNAAREGIPVDTEGKN